MWRIESSRETDPDPGRDWTYAWLFELVDVDDETKRHTVTVGMSKTAMASDDIAEESSLAYGSMGRSAVNNILSDDDPPSTLLVTTAGVVPESQ